jgi:hypothetical protein
MIYTSLYVIIFDACRSITLASGRGLCPGNLEFFGPQMALANQLDAISQSPENSRFPGANPLPLALVMDMHASKNIAHGAVKIIGAQITKRQQNRLSPPWLLFHAYNMKSTVSLFGLLTSAFIPPAPSFLPFKDILP